MKKRILIILLVIGVLAFNIITVNADEASNEAHLSGSSVNCDYGNGRVFTNEDGELSGSFTYNGASCRVTETYEAGECPAFVLVQANSYQGFCSITFSDTQLTDNYVGLQSKEEGCFYYMQQVRYTFTRNNDRWNVTMNPDTGRSVDIAESLNATETCPETIYISFPTGNVVHFDLNSGTGDNGSDRNEDPSEDGWDELVTDFDPDEDFNQDIDCPSLLKVNTEGSVGWMLKTILNYIRIIGPILVVLLSAIDFIKAVVGTDEKAMKEAQSKLVIRLVAAVLLFLVPTLVELLLSFINATTCTLN